MERALPFEAEVLEMLPPEDAARLKAAQSAVRSEYSFHLTEHSVMPWAQTVLQTVAGSVFVKFFKLCVSSFLKQ